MRNIVEQVLHTSPLHLLVSVNISNHTHETAAPSPSFNPFAGLVAPRIGNGVLSGSDASRFLHTPWFHFSALLFCQFHFHFHFLISRQSFPVAVVVAPWPFILLSLQFILFLSISGKSADAATPFPSFDYLKVYACVSVNIMHVNFVWSWSNFW